MNKEPLIPRESPELPVRVGSTEVTLDYDNTTVCEFGNNYEYMDHIFVRNRALGNSALYIFGQSPIADDLKERGFPSRKDPYPSDQDIVAYLQWQRDVLRRELDEGLGGELE